MKNREIVKMVEALAQSGKWKYLGIRYETKSRDLGDVCEPSRDNPNREDPRDFPEYSSVEYQELPELGGTSSWMFYNEDHLMVTPDYDDDDDLFQIVESLDFGNLPGDTSSQVYIIGGNAEDTDFDTCDSGEIVICDAQVVGVISRGGK